MNKATALQVATELATGFRSAEKYQTSCARSHSPRNAAILRKSAFAAAAKSRRSAEAIELLLKLPTDVTHLHRELTKVSGMLDYMAFSPVVGIEVTKEDRRAARAQLKVTKHILATIQP